MDAAMADAPEQARRHGGGEGPRPQGQSRSSSRAAPGRPTRRANKTRQRMACQARAIPKLMFDRRVATLAVPKGHARPVLRNSIVAGTFQSYGQSNQVTWRCLAQTHPDCNDGKRIA